MINSVNDCLNLIFSFASHNDVKTLNSISLVCKQWKVAQSHFNPLWIRSYQDLSRKYFIKSRLNAEDLRVDGAVKSKFIQLNQDLFLEFKNLLFDIELRLKEDPKLIKLLCPDNDEDNLTTENCIFIYRNRVNVITTDKLNRIADRLGEDLKPVILLLKFLNPSKINGSHLAALLVGNFSRVDERYGAKPPINYLFLMWMIRQHFQLEEYINEHNTYILIRVIFDQVIKNLTIFDLEASGLNIQLLFATVFNEIEMETLSFIIRWLSNSTHVVFDEERNFVGHRVDHTVVFANSNRANTQFNMSGEESLFLTKLGIELQPIVPANRFVELLRELLNLAQLDGRRFQETLGRGVTLRQYALQRGLLDIAKLIKEFEDF